MENDVLLRNISFWILGIAVAIFGSGFTIILTWHHPIPIIPTILFAFSGILFLFSGWVFALSQGIVIAKYHNATIFEQRVVSVETEIKNIKNTQTKIIQNNNLIKNNSK